MAKPSKQGEWRVREGIEPIPGIGEGPLTDEDYERLEAAYMAPFLAADPLANSPRVCRQFDAAEGREVTVGVYERSEVAPPEADAATQEEATP